MRLIGIGIARGVDGAGAYQRLVVFEFVSGFRRHAVEDFRGLGNDLGADAVAG